MSIIGLTRPSAADCDPLIVEKLDLQRAKVGRGIEKVGAGPSLISTSHHDRA